MTTGYEVSMYRNIEMIEKHLRSIAKSLETIAHPPVTKEMPPDHSWLQMEPS